jgi:hypothetical protein
MVEGIVAVFARSERHVDWRHREHSSLSRNEVRAYGLFLGQKGRTFVSVRRRHTHVVIVIVSWLQLFSLSLLFSAGTALTLSLFLAAHLILSLSLSCVWSVVGTGVLLRYELLSLSLSLSLSFSRLQNVAWVKSALWRHLSRSNFTRFRPFARWSRWPACYETQLIWELDDGNDAGRVVSLICLLHSSC